MLNLNRLIYPQAHLAMKFLGRSVGNQPCVEMEAKSANWPKRGRERNVAVKSENSINWWHKISYLSKNIF